MKTTSVASHHAILRVAVATAVYLNPWNVFLLACPSSARSEGRVHGPPVTQDVGGSYGETQTSTVEVLYLLVQM